MSESEYVDYNGLVELARQTAIEHAKGWIPKLCEALKRENPEMSKEDIRETVANDCADFWSKATIRKFMPDEYKNEAAAALAKKKHEKDRLLSVTGDGQQFTNENTAGMNPAQEGSVSPTGQESTSFENTDRGPGVKPVAQTVNKLQNELKNVREVLESQIQSSS
jgi:hypothetical protein